MRMRLWPHSCDLPVIILVKACFSWQDNDILSAGRPFRLFLSGGTDDRTRPGAHTETETHTWSVNVPDHPQRADSPDYIAAKNKMNEIAAQAPGLLYGPGPFQDHHGGALWLQDSQGWFMVRNLAGIEWSAQFCVSADMRVLTADLRWIPAGEVRAGDHLAGFDESLPVSGRRHWRRSVVERAEVITRPCYSVVFADGSRACATADHLWLACGPAGSGYAAAGWYRTDALVSRQGGARAVVKPTGVWSEDTSWEAGYLAAAFDGEGHFIHGVRGGGAGHGGGQAVGIVFSQRDNEMYAEVVRCLKVLGFTFREETRPDLRQVIIARRHEVLRFLGSIRPRRMLAQFKFEWLCQFNAMERVPVKEVSYAGERPVAVLTTSTGTYIAEGLASHNCADPVKVDLLRQNAKRLYDLLAPEIKQELDPHGLLDTPITDAAGWRSGPIPPEGLPPPVGAPPCPGCANNVGFLNGFCCRVPSCRTRWCRWGSSTVPRPNAARRTRRRSTASSAPQSRRSSRPTPAPCSRARSAPRARPPNPLAIGMLPCG